jgi:hypothetical protein
MTSIHQLIKNAITANLEGALQGWGLPADTAVVIDATGGADSIEKFISKTRAMSEDKIEACVYIPSVSFVALERPQTANMTGQCTLIVRDRYRSAFTAASAIATAMQAVELYIETDEESGITQSITLDPTGMQVELDFGADAYLIVSQFTYNKYKA